MRGKLLRVIGDSFKNITSKVFLNGNVSEPFDILQGARQGSTGAPFYYTVNDILTRATNSNVGLKIADLKLCPSTQADDIVLLSLSSRSLHALLTICGTYANKWRYSYNNGKCATMVIDRKLSKRREPLKISYGNTTIAEEPGNYSIRNGRYPFNVGDVKQSIRGTFLSLSNKVTGIDGKNPLTMIKLYKTSVLRRALFGCELWYNISQTTRSHTTLLPKVHTGTSVLTRSDMVCGLLGISRIEAYIDQQKLRFTGTLCRNPARQYH